MFISLSRLLNAFQHNKLQSAARECQKNSRKTAEIQYVRITLIGKRYTECSTKNQHPGDVSVAVPQGIIWHVQSTSRRVLSAS
jgi:hypothetical protein